MKKLLCLLLSGLMALSLAACGSGAPEGSDAPEGGGNAAYEQYEVAKAQLPDIPKEPSYAEVEEKLSKLDYDSLGDAKYAEESEKIYNEYDKAREAYTIAVEELRGDGIEAVFDSAMYGFTQKTASTVFGAKNGENVAYSPANFYLAMCMLCEVTGGESRQQLMDLLGMSSIDDVRKISNELWRNLYRDDESGKTLLANSMWMNDNVSFNEETIKRLAEDYFASGFSVPMGTVETNNALQSWINENTGGLLKEAAKGVQTNPNTVLALISTLFFKDGWSDRFNEAATSKDEFTCAGGQKTETDFMHSTESHGGYFHARDDGYTIAELRMESGACMRFLLPDEGVSLASLVEEGKVAGGMLSYDLGLERKAGKIEWSVPKFDIDSDLDMKEMLRQMNIRDIFDETKANFSPLTDMEKIIVSDIKHAGRVKIDEEGCEAAAFTAIMVEATAFLPDELEVVEMNLNRPFAFMITGASGMPLFMGTVNQI